jgi:hypothetical protein
MKKLILFLLILFSSSYVHSKNSHIIDIAFDNYDSLIINHNGCNLYDTLQETKKLIIIFSNCENDFNEINIKSDIIHKVHWSQHNKNHVWVVINLNKTYHSVIESYLQQYVVKFIAKKDYSGNKITAKTMFTINDIVFNIPIENMTIENFLDKSIGFVPDSIIKDGLPHFGSKRDDWNNQKIRKHLGYDIYFNHKNILATADGVVTRVKKSKRSGLYIKIRHEHDMETLYIHLSSTSVKLGDRVKRGQIIARTDDATGNAVLPQLHFELKLNLKHTDPLLLIKKFYKNNSNIMDKISSYEALLPSIIKQRDKLVKQFLRKINDTK